VTPVELASFEVTPLADALKLDWRTALEQENKGFHVERRVKGNDAWSALTFVPGAGTTNREQKYAYVDADVVSETTYQYRLRQEDLDGSIQLSPIREGRIASASTGAMVNRLEQNRPNPFSEGTSISYTLAKAGTATIEIVDMVGNTVRTFTVSGSGSLTWDGTDAGGTAVANGVYVYKLVGEGFSISKKLTVAR
jgi:hypothetical protein